MINDSIFCFHTLYIYIYIVLFGPVKPESGVIPSGQENHSGAEHLSFPGRELNVIYYQAIFKNIEINSETRKKTYPTYILGKNR